MSDPRLAPLDADVALLLAEIDATGDAPAASEEPLDAELLELLDAAELDLDSVSLRRDESSSSSRDGAAARHSRAMEGTKRSVKRQRDELEHLRRQVVELEAQLKALRDARAGPTDVAGPVTTRDAAWERIASHQKRDKEKAERENMRLRGMLEGQLRIATGLERLLRKRPLREVLQFCDDENKRQHRIAAVDPIALDGPREGQLTALYERIDSVFEENGLAGIVSDSEDTWVRSAIDGSLFVEVLYAKLFPFGVDRTSRAVWQAITTGYMELPGGVYRGNALAGDEIAATYELPMRIRRLSATMHVRVTMKRFACGIEDSREVYTWYSSGVTRSENETYDGIGMMEEGWAVVERVSSEDDEEESTIVKCCSRMRPGAQSLKHQLHVGAITDIMIGSYHHNYSTLSEATERILMHNELHVR